jgi:hypothetical protein
LPRIDTSANAGSLLLCNNRSFGGIFFVLISVFPQLGTLSGEIVLCSRTPKLGSTSKGEGSTQSRLYASTTFFVVQG